jgi:hypothetical protein
MVGQDGVGINTMAQMSSRWPNLLKELEAFQEECEQSWFTIELGHLVRAIVVFATQQCLFRSVASTTNTYGHPRASVLKEALAEGACLQVVTEECWLGFHEVIDLELP